MRVSLQKRLLGIFVSLAVTLSTAHAQTEVARPSGPTGASRSEYFASLAALVLVSKNSAASQFCITLGLVKPLPIGATLVVDFENPLRPDAPFRVSVTELSKRELVIQSPEFEGIYSKRAYLAKVEVIGSDGKTIAVHEQWIWFEMSAALKSVYATKILE